jgi:hypothetical protein
MNDQQVVLKLLSLRGLIIGHMRYCHNHHIVDRFPVLTRPPLQKLVFHAHDELKEFFPNPLNIKFGWDTQNSCPMILPGHELKGALYALSAVAEFDSEKKWMWLRDDGSGEEFERDFPELAHQLQSFSTWIPGLIP